MRWLYLFHRWSAVILGAVVLLWLVSGVVMLFYGRPQWSATERLRVFQAFSPEHAIEHLAPGAAWSRLGVPGWPDAVSVRRQSGRVMYVFRQGQRWYRVDDTGRVFSRADYTPAWAAEQVGAALASSEESLHVAELHVDQWTQGSRFDSLRPLLKVTVGDAVGREYYVSTQSGDIVMDTTREERVGNWFGTVIHWFYFTELRQHGGFWRQLILWVSGASALMVLAGSLVALARLRLGRRRYSGGRASPYRERVHKFHHLVGLGMSLLLLAWLFSGWISLAPLGLLKHRPLKSPGSSSIDGAVLAFGPKAVALGPYREVEWARLGTEPTVFLRGEGVVAHLERTTGGRLVAEFERGWLEQHVASLFPDYPLRTFRLIEAYTHEYYPQGGREIPLPAYEASFDDPDHTVLFIDPKTAQPVRKVDASARAYRWLFRALHVFDFPPFHVHSTARLWWVCLASAIGIALALTGCKLGLARVRRKISRPLAGRRC